MPAVRPLLVDHVPCCICSVFLNGDLSISVTGGFRWVVETAMVIQTVAGLRVTLWKLVRLLRPPGKWWDAHFCVGACT